MSNTKLRRRPSEKSRKLTWRLSNAVFSALFAGLAWRFSANKVLLVIFCICALFALINVLVVPKRNRSDNAET
jgi:hypothetical protein